MAVKVMIVLNTSWNLVNFRAGLIRSLVEQGYEVIAVAPQDEYSVHLPALGCRYVPLNMDNKGTHPGRDAILLWRFWCLMRRERPDVFLGYTVKPNLYGSIAAHFLGIPVVNNIAGLGAVFIKNNWLTRLVRRMYQVSLSRSARVFFQNEEDRDMFVQSGLVCHTIADRIPGSGVDLERFSFIDSKQIITKANTAFSFILVARMLWDKGVGEYVEAARILKSRHYDVNFGLLGFLGVENPAAIDRRQMDEWVAEGVVNYLGVSDDIRPYIRQADCVVLPSYREGVSRALLEAAAMGCPIVTTDAAGCRDVVDHGVNGFLCHPRDALDLADKLEMMIKLTSKERTEMGRLGRLKVEREFDEKMVINKYMQIIDLIAS